MKHHGNDGGDGGMNSRLVCTSARTRSGYAARHVLPSGQPASQQALGRWITSGRDGAVCSRSRRWSEWRKLVYGSQHVVSTARLFSPFVRLIEASRALELFVSRCWSWGEGSARAGRGGEVAKGEDWLRRIPRTVGERNRRTRCRVSVQRFKESRLPRGTTKREIVSDLETREWGWSFARLTTAYLHLFHCRWYQARELSARVLR